MFTACLAFLRGRPKRPAGANVGARTIVSGWAQRAVPPGRAPRVAVLGALNFFLASGCALDARPGDGLVSEGQGVVVSPMLPYDRPPPPIEMDWPDCKAQDVFTQKVVPHYVKRCVECHDGTNGNAIIKLATFGLTGAAADPSIACRSSLAQGAVDPDNNQVALLIFVDPARPDKDHEFKYEDVAEFNAYKADLLTWLNAERPASAP